MQRWDEHAAKRSITRYPWLRSLLKVLIVIGFILVAIGPIARIRNEGFGDLPGPVDVSSFWQTASYVLIPLGVTTIVFAGIALVVIDRQR